MIKIRAGFIGAGNMSQALVEGLLDSEGISSAQLVAMDPDPEVSSILAERGVAMVGSLDELLENCELVIIAVKPQIAEEVLLRISPFITPQKVILSLMAGVTTSKIESFLSKGSVVVRCMPQTLVRIRAGSCAICAGTNASISDLETVQELLELVGEVVTVRESQMDAVTGLSGSGPAFVYSMIESLAAGGVREGLTKEVALKLAAQTMLGSSRMIMHSDLSPSQLKEQVTSPGGTTIAGLEVMERNNIDAILRDAVTAATHRSRELGNS